MERKGGPLFFSLGAPPFLYWIVPLAELTRQKFGVPLSMVETTRQPNTFVIFVTLASVSSLFKSILRERDG